MSQKKIVKPIVDDLNASKKPKPSKEPKQSGTPPKHGPLEPAELDQDQGGGYNPDGTYPQT